MADKIKLILKYGEQRRSIFFNAHNKDDYGRHRGQVLYGMKLSGSGTVISIAPGAVYTSQGQRLFLDVPDASVDLGPSGTNVFSSAHKAEYPICVMIFLSYQYNVAQIAQAVEATSAVGLVGASISARVVPFDRNNAAPTYNLLPLDPVTLDTAQPGGYTSIQTWNGPAVNAEPTANKQADSIQFGEIPLGYVMLGVNPADNSLPTDLSSPGVSIVSYHNAFDMVSDIIGTDVLLPRAYNPVTGALASPSTGTALKQGYSARTTNVKLSPPLAIPFFGTPENGGSGTRVDSPFDTYRQPSFFRDGDSILEAMRRLDIILRQVVNRTGDQYVVSLFQDGIDSNIPPQGTIEKILASADGTSSATHNLNTKTYATGATGGDPINHTLKSGVIPHVEDTLIGKLSTDEGDSLTSAVTALDIAISVILDAMGQSIPRSQLRAGTGSFTPLAWGDVPEGRPSLVVPTIGGATTSPYLTTQSTHDAIVELAKRTLAAPGTNWLANSNFMAGQTLSGNETTPPPYWAINGTTGTWATTAHATDYGSGADFRAPSIAVSLAANAFFDQDIIGAAADNFIGQAVDGSSYLSGSLVIKNTGSFPITFDVIGYSDTAGTSGVLSITSASIPAGSDMRLATVTAKITAGTTINRLKFRIRAVTGSNAVSFVCSGAALNTGMPINVTTANSAAVDFVNRWGGPNAQMRGHLYLGTNQVKNMADGTAATDAVTKQQLDLKAPLASPALTGAPTAPTPSPGDNSTLIATTAFVQAAFGTIVRSRDTSAPSGANWFVGSAVSTGAGAHSVSTTSGSRISAFRTVGNALLQRSRFHFVVNFNTGNYNSHWVNTIYDGVANVMPASLDNTQEHMVMVLSVWDSSVGGSNIPYAFNAPVLVKSSNTTPQTGYPNPFFARLGVGVTQSSNGITTPASYNPLLAVPALVAGLGGVYNTPGLMAFSISGKNTGGSGGNGGVLTVDMELPELDLDIDTTTYYQVDIAIYGASGGTTTPGYITAFQYQQ